MPRRFPRVNLQIHMLAAQDTPTRRWTGTTQHNSGNGPVKAKYNNISPNIIGIQRETPESRSAIVQCIPYPVVEEYAVTMDVVQGTLRPRKQVKLWRDTDANVI